MKMSLDKKDRMLLAAGLAVAVVLVLVASVLWGILPLLDSRREMESALIAKRDQIAKAKRDLDYVPSLTASHEALQAQIEEIRNACVLRPTLGSYLVGVSEQIESLARSNGVKIEEVREIGIVDIPQKRKTSALQTFKCFVVLVNGEGGYGGICGLLRELEKQNPFFCVTELSLSGQPDKPEMQRIMARMEWPIEPSTERKKESAP